MTRQILIEEWVATTLAVILATLGFLTLMTVMANHWVWICWHIIYPALCGLEWLSNTIAQAIIYFFF